MGRNEKRVASPVDFVRVSSTQTTKASATHSARRQASRSSDVRFAESVAGRSFSTEHRHGCAGVEQQVGTASSELVQQAPQHCFASHLCPFASHAPVAGTRPARAIVAISTTETNEFVGNRNIATPVWLRNTLPYYRPDSPESSLVSVTIYSTLRRSRSQRLCCSTTNRELHPPSAVSPFAKAYEVGRIVRCRTATIQAYEVAL